MLLFVIKMQEEELQKYREQLHSENLFDDVLWAAEDILLDETTLQNYIKISRTTGTLKEAYSISLFGTPIYSDTQTSDEFVYECLKYRFDPNNCWEVLKMLIVREEAELEVRSFFDSQNLDYEVVIL